MSNQNKFHLSIKARKLLLTLAAVAAIVLFFLLTPNKTWIQSRIFSYWKDFLKLNSNTSLEYRKAKRFGVEYTITKQIADSFPSKENVLVLIPPSAYFKVNELQYEVPEPGVFYYFTGVKTVTANSPNVLNANWIVTVKNRMLLVDSITNTSILKDSIASWTKLLEK